MHAVPRLGFRGWATATDTHRQNSQGDKPCGLLNPRNFVSSVAPAAPGTCPAPSLLFRPRRVDRTYEVQEHLFHATPHSASDCHSGHRSGRHSSGQHNSCRCSACCAISGIAGQSNRSCRRCRYLPPRARSPTALQGVAVSLGDVSGPVATLWQGSVTCHGRPPPESFECPESPVGTMPNRAMSIADVGGTRPSEEHILRVQAASGTPSDRWKSVASDHESWRCLELQIIDSFVRPQPAA